MVRHRGHRRGAALWGGVGGALIILTLAISPAMAHGMSVDSPRHMLLTSELVGADAQETSELESMLEQGDQPDASQAPEATDQPEATDAPEATDQAGGNDQGQNADEQGSNGGDEASQAPEATDQAGSDGSGDSGSGG